MLKSKKYLPLQPQKINFRTNKMKQAVIKELSTKELEEKAGSENTNLVKLRMSHAVSPIENPLKIKHARKTVARLKTELRKRELAK